MLFLYPSTLYYRSVCVISPPPPRRPLSLSIYIYVYVCRMTREVNIPTSIHTLAGSDVLYVYLDIYMYHFFFLVVVR